MHKNLIYNDIMNGIDTAALQIDAIWKLDWTRHFKQTVIFKKTDLSVPGSWQLGTSNGDGTSPYQF